MASVPETTDLKKQGVFPLRFSMRFTLGITIVLMGVLGLVLALVTGEIYRHQTLENQRAALQELAELGVGERLRILEETSRDLGLALQSETDFRRALASGNRAQLARALQNQYRQYSATAKAIRLEELVVYDTDYQLLATATRSAATANKTASVCPGLIERARERRGAKLLQSVAKLCRNGQKTRYAVLVPIGGLRVTGHLAVVTDPVPAIARIESKLGLPVRIRDSGDHQLYASGSWPSPDAMRNTLVAEYGLDNSRGEPLLKVAVLRDIEPLQKSVQDTRYLVTSIALITTVLGVMLALIILEKTALQPLKTLTQHLRRVSTDKNHLGQQVEAGGIAEIRELAEDFNRMAQELDRLYGSLEHMAFTDPLTNLPNRARFRDSLDESVRAYTQRGQPFALFLMDLDRFKEVNDTLGHQVGDLLLQEVSMRLRGVLRESDTVTRLDTETILDLESKMVARLGGDEFAAILPRVNVEDDASSIARKLLLAMQEPFLIHTHVVSIGISIGIVLYPQHGQDIDTLMQRADAAMYFAKNNQIGLAFPDAMQQTELI
jgi:GGDEF domain-containing protein